MKSLLKTLIGLSSLLLLVACANDQESKSSVGVSSSVTDQVTTSRQSQTSKVQTTEVSSQEIVTEMADTTQPATAQVTETVQVTEAIMTESLQAAPVTEASSQVQGGMGAWEATSGVLDLDEDTPVYAGPSKAGKVIFTQLKDTSVEWDLYTYENGEWWYSFVATDGQTRYYIAYSDVGH